MLSLALRLRSMDQVIGAAANMSRQQWRYILARRPASLYHPSSLFHFTVPRVRSVKSRTSEIVHHGRAISEPAGQPSRSHAWHAERRQSAVWL